MNPDADRPVELTFNFEFRRWQPDNQAATFQRSIGGASPIPFGNVRSWQQRYTARRFNDQRSQRQHAAGQISAAGTWKGDPSIPLAYRRAALLTQQRAMLDEVNHADGTLIFGDFNEVVRIEDLTAEINQAITGIDWSFTASYSLFPAESGYATVEMSVSERESAEDGEQLLTFNGRIFATDKAAAVAKLTALRAATVVTGYGYTLAQRLRNDLTCSFIQGNGDRTSGLDNGTTESDPFSAAATSGQSTDGNAAGAGLGFTELTFNEEYRRRKADLVSWNLRISSRADTRTGLTLTTFSGSVTAGGTVDAAYGAAKAKADSLGLNKEASVATGENAGTSAFLVSAQINWDQRRAAEAPVANAVEFVRLDFAYEYQGKSPAGYSYFEVNTETAKDSFGADSEAVSGYVVAATPALAQGIYDNQVRAGYAARLLHNERVSKAQQTARKGPSATTITHEIRLDFSFTALKVKTGTNVAYRYALEVAKNYQTLELLTHVRGSVFCASESLCPGAVDDLITGLGITGKPLTSVRNIDKEYTTESDGNIDGESLTSRQGYFIKYDFDETYTSRLTGATGIIENEVSEEVTYSATRWVVQPLPYDVDTMGNLTGGVSIPQPAGVQEGGRTVRGSVTAPDMTTCLNWIKKQRLLLSGPLVNGRRVTPYPLPEKIDTQYVFVPFLEGIARDEGGVTPALVANVRVYRMNFTFGEILPVNAAV